MATSPVLCRITLPYVSGLPQDVAVNDFVVEFDPTDETERSDVGDALIAFYNDVPTGLSGIYVAKFLGTQLSRSSLAASIDYYDLTGHLDGTPHGSPVASRSWTLAAAIGSGSNQPDQLALVNSFHGDLGSLLEIVGDTRPKARRRGRIYLGPLRQDYQTLDANNSPRPTDAMRECINVASHDLADALTFDSETATRWHVWSRAGEATYTITGGSVDNRFDALRKRSADATDRDGWSYS